MRICLILPILMLSATSASAGDKPRYAPAPSWVTPAPAIDVGRLGADSSPVVILDQQQRLADGQVWSYVDSATRIASEQALTSAGTISLQWQPDGGDLIVHRIAILRGGQTIDLVATSEPLTILRRERGLEQLTIDGVLTATMPAKGLQLGDVLRVTYSTTHSDPVLQGAMQSIALLIADPARAEFARARILWNKSTDLRWKSLALTGTPKLATIGTDRELTIQLPLAKQPDLPADSPPRYRPLPVLEASTFRDWADVSRVMAPLYRSAGLIPPGSPLADEVARIKATSGDPRQQAALALRSVQSEVRYLFNGLDHGNYVPQTPEKTWTVRYGDCKAKTLLLLALLDALGIKAEAAMAHTQLGDYVPRRLPSAAAFNHVLVHATIDGRDYWLDGTAAGSRLDDLADTPNLRTVLPVRAAGAALVEITPRPNARATVELRETIDQSAGIGIVAPFSAEITFRGPLADQLNATAAAATGEKRKEAIDGLVTKLLRPATIVSRDISYDAARGAAVVRASGLTSGDWARDNRRFEWTLDRTVGQLKFDGDRARPEWRDIPVATAGIQSVVVSTRLTLPGDGKGFIVEGDRTLPPQLGGTLVRRTVTDSNGVVAVDDRVDEIAAEIPATAAAATRAALTLAQSRRLTVRAPVDYPRRWQVVAAAAAEGRFKPIEAAYAAAIADATDKARAYLARAQFRGSVYDRKGAIADLDEALKTRPDAQTYLARAGLLYQTHADSRALADARAANALDPGSFATIVSLAQFEALNGQRAAALQRLDARIAAGGEDKPRLLDAKADLQANGDDAEGALATIDEAIALKPGDPSLLNSRCWIKGTKAVRLESALKDCTKAIEQGASSAATLDSRAMVYFKLGRPDDALTDLEAALALVPELPASLYMRGIIALRQGKTTGEADLAAARHAAPRIDEDYARYGIKPSAAVLSTASGG